MCLKKLLLPFVAILVIGTVFSATVNNVNESCLRFPVNDAKIYNSISNVWNFDPRSGNLTVDLSGVLDLETCSDQNDKKKLLRVDLISTATPNMKNGCYKIKKDSFVQSSGIVNSTQTNVTFSFVQGLYFIKLSPCTISKSGSCKVSKSDDSKSVCIGGDEDQINEGQRMPLKFIPELQDPGEEDICEFKFPTNVSADVVNLDGVTLENHCDVNIRAVIPLCSPSDEPDTVTLTLVDVGLGDVCTFADFELKQRAENEEKLPIALKQCEQSPNSTSLSGQDCGEAFPAALLDHRVYGLARNSSYCMFFKLNHPNCQGQFGCMFYTETISCGLLEGSQRRGFRIQVIFTLPVFIGVVSLILISSLAVLAWLIIQCSKKKPGTPLMTQTQIGKKPPRSLTEDDLEHISRLPSQEIVLVYFPDTNRFKELNRKLRNWLITLDVNDVKDIYDEKATEEVLRNPEQWVRDALAGPEKRIILVCSRLAYECLTAIKRGISSPRFVESDPHFGLLTRTIQYLDREMRGNYRNLICVRYEDLKICSRQYSSEAFNLVPGTEYVLPQHLEDIYRWIHPRQPNPDCWSESRLEVRELLEAIKQYRHHDDNIFTVQFSSSNVVCGD